MQHIQNVDTPTIDLAKTKTPNVSNLFASSSLADIANLGQYDENPIAAYGSIVPHGNDLKRFLESNSDCV